MFCWTPSLAVGVDEIDGQHKEWFRHAAAFMDGLDHRTREDIDGLIAYLRRYTVMHFAVEESWMREFRYPQFLAHKAQHDRFLRDLEKLSAEHRTRGLEPMRVGAWLGQWMTDHVSLTDLRLAEFMTRARRAG
ncbi:MAG TPA: bacteriohemerythrin [Anaeromyxobacteraceae bacterium]|nr:bacteriohemerythrin [Anaeromyxobacteraceae bacterium]